MPKQVFVTGTDTGIGKSLVCAVLMAGLKGRYWKPIQSGLEGQTDTQWVREVTGLSGDRFFPETYRLSLPLSPHLSAAKDGLRIELEAFELPEVKAEEHLVVEGAGGIMVPLNDREYLLDLMKRLRLPVLLVASSRLGTLNHTLLSLEKLRGHGLSVAGVVMNGPLNPDNREGIEFYGKTNVIAEIQPLSAIDPGALESVFHKKFIR